MLCSVSTDLDLIWQVKLHPELYDTQHVNFQNSKVREATWISIAAEIHATKFVCSSRWKELEKNFREMIIAKRNDIPCKRPGYTRQMLFLAPFIHAEENILEGKISRSTASSSTDPLIDFFLSMGKIVQKFDKTTQVEMKNKVFQLVRNAEMSMDGNKPAYFPSWGWPFILFTVFFILLNYPNKIIRYLDHN